MSEGKTDRSAELIALGELKGQMIIVIDFFQNIGPVLEKKVNQEEFKAFIATVKEEFKIIHTVITPLKTKEDVKESDKRRIEWVAKILPAMLPTITFLCGIFLHASFHWF